MRPIDRERLERPEADLGDARGATASRFVEAIEILLSTGRIHLGCGNAARHPGDGAADAGGDASAAARGLVD